MSNESSLQPLPQHTPGAEGSGPAAVTYIQVTPPPKGASVTSLVLGLVSIVMGFTFFLPLIGLICAFVGLVREPAGRAYAVVGLLLNGFFILLWLIFGAIVVSWFTAIGNSAP
jgi:Na+/phosphate symporter